MLSESFKCFFAVTVLDLGPIGLALLAHIYSKYAICKSCEASRCRTSRFCLSPGNQRSRAGAARALRGGMVTGPGRSPAARRTSVGAGGPSALVPRSPIKYPSRWSPVRCSWERNLARRHPHRLRCQPALAQGAGEPPTCGWCSCQLRGPQAWGGNSPRGRPRGGPPSGHPSASHPRAGRFDISTAPDHGCDGSSKIPRVAGCTRWWLFAHNWDAVKVS